MDPRYRKTNAQLLQELAACWQMIEQLKVAYEACKAQGEPVAEVVSDHQAGLYDELPLGTLLYTAAPSIPEGWQPVPVEPTEAMQLAGERVYHPEDSSPSPYDVYRAMLAAAPKP